MLISQLMEANRRQHERKSITEALYCLGHMTECVFVMWRKRHCLFFFLPLGGNGPNNSAVISLTGCSLMGECHKH